jgi:hypothetical protein
MWRPFGGVGKRLTVLKEEKRHTRHKSEKKKTRKKKEKWKYQDLERRKRRLKSKIEDPPHT